MTVVPCTRKDLLCFQTSIGPGLVARHGPMDARLGGNRPTTGFPTSHNYISYWYC